MLYQVYDQWNESMRPARAAAAWWAEWLGHASPQTPGGIFARQWQAGCEVFGSARLTHARPDFGIPEIEVDGERFAVHEEVALRLPFGDLLRFVRAGGEAQPKVLIAAPMSGHFATLLRDTVRVMLADHDVYLTDWGNAREVPLAEGRFGFDDYVHYLVQFMHHLGPGAHLVAICQPCVAALAATALMAEDDDPAAPASLTLMAGPVDTRINPTEVNRLATERPLSWFEQRMIQTVPWRYPGWGRKVYPGFVQLTAFMSMNPERHLKAFEQLRQHLADGDEAAAATIRDFYDEYFAVADLPAEFYLETIDRVFQRWELARGCLDWRGRRVDPRAIRRTALLTVEGERDDICAIGQTVAAHDLCSTIRPYLKTHHVQTGVGHYGVFSGRRWAGQIYPRIREMTRTL